MNHQQSMNNKQSIINNKFSAVFFGTGAYVLPVLEVLSKDFEVPLVVTTEKSDSEPVSAFCKKNKIECLPVSSLSDKIINNKLSAINSPVGVLANFGLIIPQEVLDIFPKGIINIHPSLLPKYRGSTPAQTAILNGDAKTGVSIIKLDEQVDHGPILAQKEEPILVQDTAETLYTRLFKIGADLLDKSLRIYLSGDLQPVEQKHADATFTKTLTRDSGFIDLNGKWSIVNLPRRPLRREASKAGGQLSRMIRAYSPWPGVWFKYCHSERSEESQLDNKIIKLLPENKIQVEGKNPMTYKDFTNGYPEGKEILNKLQLSYQN